MENGRLCIVEHCRKQLETILESLKYGLRIPVPLRGIVRQDRLVVLVVESGFPKL